MPIQTATGNLVIIGLNTSAPKVFWNGAEVLGIIEIQSSWEKGESVVKFKLSGTNDAQYMEMISAGIVVKKEKKRR